MEKEKWIMLELVIVTAISVLFVVAISSLKGSTGFLGVILPWLVVLSAVLLPFSMQGDNKRTRLLAAAIFMVGAAGIVWQIRLLIFLGAGYLLIGMAASILYLTPFIVRKLSPARDPIMNWYKNLPEKKKLKVALGIIILALVWVLAIFWMANLSHTEWKPRTVNVIVGPFRTTMLNTLMKARAYPGTIFSRAETPFQFNALEEISGEEFKETGTPVYFACSEDLQTEGMCSIEGENESIPSGFGTELNVKETFEEKVYAMCTKEYCCVSVGDVELLKECE